MRDHLSFDLTH